MKIGIITIMDYTNYGNRLQNYALYYVLKKFFRCKVVTLESIKEKPFYDGNYLTWCKEKVAQICCVFPKFAEKKFGNNITRWTNFKKWSKRIPTKKYYGDSRLPEGINEKYDYFFAGSDQIWNYNFDISRLYNHFLGFAENNKKIAISGSFGVDEISDIWKEKYISGLEAFSSISVREDAGQKIVKELLGQDVPVLIDPVMMLNKEEWLQVAKKPRVNCEKPYILKYYLGDKTEENKIDIWAKKNGYEIYELLNDKIPELYSAGPGEFISLINNAALICSDSFHCIVFSIIFSKPFVVYERKGTENYMSSRLETLLNKFNFKNRWANLLSEKEYLNCDYEGVHSKIKCEQKKFIDYIEKILK